MYLKQRTWKKPEVRRTGGEEAFVIFFRKFWSEIGRRHIFPQDGGCLFFVRCLQQDFHKGMGALTSQKDPPGPAEKGMFVLSEEIHQSNGSWRSQSQRTCKCRTLGKIPIGRFIEGGWGWSWEGRCSIDASRSHAQILDDQWRAILLQRMSQIF